MRNLKKILALVLALIMSLSLMATAGASSFPDVDDENPYATAIEVLDKLKVFQGFDDGTFKPTETLNRAQAAVLVYRIATGDVEDKYLENYTFMQQSKFEDLDGYNWAKGYINYCQNAEIVVGTSATTFEPGAKVTGYQLLVMLLRTLGYGKAGEFSDPKGWELQTAAIAEREGILENVTKGDLGAAAPRQMVAEILFRGLLTEKVAHSPLAANGYTKTGKTLGQEQFGLEQVEGVVMANEWANLKENGNKVLAAGKTDIKIAKVQDVGATVEVGKTYTLDCTTDLDAVGLNHTAYIAGKSGDKQVLTIEATGNDVKYNEGASKTVDGLRDGLTLNNDTEWFKNYAQDWDDNATSDYLIRYAVAKSAVEADDDWDEFINVTVKDTVATRKVRVTTLNASGAVVETDVDCYVRSIQPGKTITVIDQEIMQSIFYTADRLVNSNDVTNVQDYVYGEVYVGTASTKDVSDTMSWVGFKAEYFTVDVNSRKFGSVPNGDSLRIVDNDGDGVAEYVLWVAYTQAKAVDTVDGGLLFSRNNGSSGLRMADYTGNNLNANDELALGDIANYYVIDKKLSIWKADVVTDTIKTKNFKDVTVTLADGTEKGQSGILNATTLEDNILNMSDKPEYNMYLDEYGYIRTYELAEGRKYTLLTEMYGGATNNYNYINPSRWIAEMKAGDSAIAERVVANSTGNPFITPNYTWTSRVQTTNGNATAGYNPNYLQPATAHLGINASWASAWLGGTTYVNVGGTATGSGLYRDTAWSRTVYQVGTPAMFNYGAVTYNTNANGTATTETTTPNSFSFTNVALYTLEDEAVNLETASKLHTNTNGEQLYRSRVVLAGQAAGTLKTEKEWKAAYKATDRSLTDLVVDAWWTARLAAWDIYRVYETDYVQLKAEDYAAGKRHYNIADDYQSKYIALSNSYVDATVNTEYYIVSPNNVRYVVGYDALYAIKAETVRAAYAVARNTAADANGHDYWVADVIVIEVNSITSDYDNLGMIYYNPWETSGQVRNVSELNNQWRGLQPDYEGLAKMDVVPATSTGAPATWGNSAWVNSNYGFYRQYDTAPKSDTNGNMTAGNVTQITRDFNSYGIFAGTVKRIPTIYETSGYIDIALDGGAAAVTPTGLVKTITVDGGAYKTPVYRMDRASSGVTTASTINLLNDPSLDPYSVQEGDPVIVVYDNTKIGQAVYIVDLRAGVDINKDGTVDWNVPAWLTTLYNTIITEQTSGNGPIDTASNWVIDVEVVAPADMPRTNIKHPANVLVPKLSGVSGEIDADNTNIWNFPTITGYSTPVVTYVDANGATSTGVDDDGTLSFVAPKADGRVEATMNGKIVVTYTANAQTVTETGSTANVAIVAKDSAASATISAPTSGTLNTKTGETVTLEVDVSGVAGGMTGKTLSVSVTGVNSGNALTPVNVNGNKYTYTFVVPAANAATDHDVTATVAATTYNVSVAKGGTTGVSSVAATAGWTLGTATPLSQPGTTTWAANLEITPTFEDGYEFGSATVTAGGQVIPQDGVSAKSNWEWDTANKKLIIKTGGACENKDVSVVINGKLIEYTLTFDVDGYNNGKVYVGLNRDQAKQTEVVTGTTSMTVTKKTVLYFTAQGTAAPNTATIADTAAAGTATMSKTANVAGENGWTFTITDICGNPATVTAVKITIAD